MAGRLSPRTTATRHSTANALPQITGINVTHSITAKATSTLPFISQLTASQAAMPQTVNGRRQTAFRPEGSRSIHGSPGQAKHLAGAHVFCGP